MKKSTYSKFGTMLLLSFVLMYGIMFLNVYSVNHIMLSTTRTYMALLMVCPMAVFMLLFMDNMYENKKINYAIMFLATIVFIVSLVGLRTQEPIKDKQWMKAMIPHHSSAILTSSSATFEDPEVKQLAEDIIEAQKREIKQMKAMLKRLENN